MRYREVPLMWLTASAPETTDYEFIDEALRPIEVPTPMVPDG